MTAAPVLVGRLRDDPDFRRYWLARLVSVTGTIITAVAMPVLVYRITGSPGLTALTTTLEALPYVVVGLVAGAVADRFDRQRLMVAADLVNVVVVGSVPVAWWLGHLTVAHILLAAFLVSAIFTFFDGANFGALPVLVGRERVGEANAAIWGVGGVIDLVGPAAAGAALAVLHPADLLAVDALSYAASALLVRGIRRAMSSPRVRGSGGIPGPSGSYAGGSAGSDARLALAEMGSDVREGLSFLVHHVGVRTLTLIGTLQSAAGAGFMALFVPWADRVLHVGSLGWRFGLLYSVWGIGGILAASLSSRLLVRLGAARVTLIAMPVSAAAGIAATLVDSWVAAAAILVLWGVAYQLVIINAITYRQTVTPEHLLSRVNTTARMISWGVGWSLGALAAGALAQVVAVQTAMLALAGCGVLAVVIGWASPLRHGTPVDATPETP
ncbi:MFS transporter [Lapillicoccus sp.]|uniref:MFS transporter n=1 Tax=Lapillicoccus sp. TaxID=1909287 RepID=UPI0025F7CF20|nr:MFS transporter [Lapillicoccus sp.]